ncbi:quinone-dependent dihydroorotate dehydrogenase [Labedaea rhizosphaerae]|uniref:Dihydroorotate dehydrogenase (quinone) n=1 Tax=Labedaea rhizosphaerae TaxID=598644 RepID=A0A4R6SDX5_LABRH|nr:quinone-dependent dihydroorotate dehydrogenase [Labedaea rhizosphaerae]TDP97246.1 dihydroorotate oxidase A [Labedaea rhizosphaerae]
MVYQRLVRRALFSLGDGDPEVAHERTLAALRQVARVPPALAALRRLYAVSAPRTVFGVRFPNPVGLAAGMDKNGVAIPAWPALGFGFVEVGTVTRLAQPGNPRPRLFRLPSSQAIVNRMGFNNDGADVLAERLRPLDPAVPVGVSIGKSKVTPVAQAIDDYRHSLRALYPYGDYFAINVSSPNTPGLRGLQDREALDDLVGELTSEADALAALHGGPVKPLLVKIAPDLSDSAIADVLEVCDQHTVAGLIATNTTLGRNGVVPSESALGEEQGGLSGRPLTARARAVVSFVHEETGGALPIIGVGGIMTADDAKAMFDAGASLVQLYTGFIYRGPALVRRIARTLRSNG